MMRRKRIMLFILTVLLVLLMGIPAYAAEGVPDLNRKGSISVTMKDTDTKEIVSGGSLVLYQAAEAAECDGNYIFEYVNDFSGCTFSLSDIQSETLADSLYGYVTENGLSGLRLEIGEDGTVQFENLTPGLYLMVQEDAADGYSPVNPFLVTVPMEEENGWVYDVDASPKVGAESVSEPGTEPGNPPEGGNGKENGGENGKDIAASGAASAAGNVSKLPQTGQLWWPVPLLAAAGMILFAAGWMQRRQEYNE